MGKYKLERLPDVNGKKDWILKPLGNNNLKFYNFSMTTIEKEVNDMKIGEIKVFDEDENNWRFTKSIELL